jgi:fatty acid synthase, animal type
MVYKIHSRLPSPVLDRLSHFYLSKIKERQPPGPYRLAGFSFGGRPTFGIVDRPLILWLLLTGTGLAFTIANILQAEGAKVEVLIMLDGAPTLFHRPMFRNYAKRMITDGTLRDDVRVFILPLDSLVHDDHL